MTWQTMVVVVTCLVLATAIAAWVLWLIHDSEPE